LEVSRVLDNKVCQTISKVAAVTLMFWAVKILATTLGETGGDALSMTMKLGYAVSSLIFLVFFGIALVVQVRAREYHPFRYWTVVVASTTVGTTLSDYLDRTLGLGYVNSSILLFSGVLAILFVWYRVVGRIEFERITTKIEEAFYWLTIAVSNTLGTALGDFVATTTGLGFERGALVFAGMLAMVAAAHFGLKTIPAAFLFWAAYVLTRPLGATLGDVVTKSHAEGGLGMDRIMSSVAILATMIVMVVLATKRKTSARRG
jgi:uncharacterized membrane-anchored protein